MKIIQPARCIGFTMLPTTIYSNFAIIRIMMNIVRWRWTPVFKDLKMTTPV